MIPKDWLDLPYLKAALVRRIWYIVLPFFVVFLAGTLYCIVAPRSYKAQTVILIEPQKVPGEYVSSTVTVDSSAQLGTITQQMTSRTRLEQIIKDYGLYRHILASTTMTDAVEVFRQNINVKVMQRRAFEVSYIGKDPRKVRDVTNTLANLFITDNLKLREAQAAGTTMFLDSEIDRVQRELQGKETALREFKEKHAGFLPSNMSQNITMMANFQQQLDSIIRTIEQSKDRKVLLETQMNNLERMRAGFGNDEVWGGEQLNTVDQAGGYTPGFTSQPLSKLRDELQDLRSRYSERHPDVINLKATISKLEKNQEIGLAETDGNKVSGDGEKAGLLAWRDFDLFQTQRESLSAQLRTIQNEIVNLQKNEERIKKDLDEYRHRIESGPQVEQMMGELRRGYDQLNDNYRSLIDKKLKAQVAENLERTQQAEQFTVLDPAKLPDRPFKPNTRKILIITFCLALALGFGLGYIREYLETSVFSARYLQDRFQVPVLVSIPPIMTDRDRPRILVRKMLSATAMASMASILLYALYLLYKMDPMLHATLPG